MSITYNHLCTYIYIYIHVCPGRTFFHHLSSPISFLIATKSFLLAEFSFASLKWFQNSTFLHGFSPWKFAPRTVDVSWLMDFLWPCILGSKLLRCSTHLDVDQPQVGPSFLAFRPHRIPGNMYPGVVKKKRVLLIKVVQQNAWMLNDSKNDVFVHTLYVFSVPFHIHIFNLFSIVDLPFCCSS